LYAITHVVIVYLYVISSLPPISHWLQAFN
jgi:hypothetical protein